MSSMRTGEADRKSGPFWRSSISSLPLDRAGGFGSYVVDDAVDAADFVDDAGGDAAQEFIGERGIVGGHAVGRGHRTQRADEIEGARVAHHPDAPDRQQYREGLPDRIVETGAADLFEKHRIGLAQDVELGPRDLAGDADRQARARERMPL